MFKSFVQRAERLHGVRIIDYHVKRLARFDALGIAFLELREQVALMDEPPLWPELDV